MLLFTSLYFSDLSGSDLFYLSSLLLSHRSTISAVAQGCFFLTMFAKDLTGCFSHCCVEGGDHWIYVCIFFAHGGERCRLPTYHSLGGFQHIEQWAGPLDLYGKVSNTLGSGQVLWTCTGRFPTHWAVGWSFGPVREGRRSRPPRVSLEFGKAYNVKCRFTKTGFDEMSLRLISSTINRLFFL